MASLTGSERPNRLQFLAPALVDQVLDEALGLLDDPGVRVHNPEALALLQAVGAQVDVQKQVARLPEQVVRQALSSAPAAFDLYDLDGQPAVHYGGEAVQFDPGSAAVTVLDAVSGAQRPPVTADLIRFVKLVETLPQLEAQSTAFVCRDVPPGMGDLYRLYLALNFMRKPIVTGAFSVAGWWAMWEMLAAAAGGEQALADRPTAIFDICPSPPLLWSDLTGQNLIDCARKGVPAQLVSMPLAGVTSPVTLSAAVVQHCAESLSGIVIHQAARAGAPVVWGGAPAAADMRSGATPMGDVNTWLIDSATIQVGKRLNLPTHTYMGSSDAKQLDMQAGLEAMGGVLLAALSGCNMVSGAGMIDFLRCQSFEKLVIDAEMIGMAKRMLAGITPRDQPMALDLMRQSAHRADFLSKPHTRQWLNQELYIPSDVIDRGSLEAWEKKGRLTVTQRAAARIDKLLAAYQPNGLDEALRAELRQITAAAGRRAGLSALPEF